MAGNSDIIREYLVSLGFKLDQNSLNKFDSALVKTTKAAVAFAGTLTGMATATTAFVEHVADKMEDLYWSSVRVKDGIANIQSFQLALSKVGGTANGALSAVENMAAYLRTNPAGEGFLHNLGVATRDAEGHLRSTIDIVKDFAHLPMPYWLKVKFAERFGVDEQTLQAIIRAAPEADDALTKLYKRAGINADEAGKKSVAFKNKLRDLGAIWDVISVVLETRLLPAVNAFVDVATTLAGWILTLDKYTGGLSTDMGLLAIAIWGVNKALMVTFGASVAQLVWKLLGSIALLAVGTFPALAEAVWAVAVAFSEGLIPGLWAATTAMVAFLATNPVGWAILIGAAIAGAAYLIINNWEKVKAYFGAFVDWLRGKYNTVAKIFGLPQWDDTKTPEQRQHQQDVINNVPGAADTKAPDSQPDFKERERDLGPNSLYGSPYDGGPENRGQGRSNQPGANDNFSSDPRITGKALAFFQKAGWTADQAAGIVSNLVHESGLNSRAVGDGGKAVGIAQWHPDRQAKFKEWAGHDIRNSTLEEQLGFVNHELTKGAEQFAGKMLQGARNATDAGQRVSRFYERPKDSDGEAAKRGATAQRLVDKANTVTRNVTNSVVNNVSKAAPVVRLVATKANDAAKAVNTTVHNNAPKVQNVTNSVVNNVSKYSPAATQPGGAAAQKPAAPAKLVDNARLSGQGGGNKTVVINQKTDIKVAGESPDSTARAVGREQGRVNGDMVRNFAGAST